MNILYLDCQAGISGDMTVAALLDLGVPLDYLRLELAKLSLPAGSFEISAATTERHHITARTFGVAVHDHHTHRHYAGIDTTIAASALSDGVKDTARRIFMRLAEAEAKVHGVPLNDVHFHEVGAIDSIVDIVGTAICLDYLQVETIFCSALPLGSGFVETAHGRLPVPAPATVELLRGVPVHGDCGAGERITPTGAAIIAALVSGFGKQPSMILKKTGCGAGEKDFADCPNVLRAFFGSNSSHTADDDVIVVESNIDDSTPEILGYAMEQLLEAGALDVYFIPIQMKKNRPGALLSFLCHSQQLDALARLLLAETSAIGLRYYRVDRIVLQRRITERQTEFGPVRFKQVIDSSGSVMRTSPEYDDCRRIARTLQLPCQDVMKSLSCDTNHLESSTPLHTTTNSDMTLDMSVAELLLESGLTLSLAESCSGGLIAKRITDVPGSSRYFCEGVVTYSNDAKMRLLGVPHEILDVFGAVSAESAEAMATGIRIASGSDIGISVTGIAGPDGGSAEKPVGTVFIALASPDGCKVERFQFVGSREEIRVITAWTALDWLRRYLSNLPVT